ncbi:hypothetical protein CL176_02810 [Suicoccus acidiformans]|uniref:Alpha/beta hydrolase fold-3 domain-containing protein n=1 Tax=Suicoccus acidiformans TaxID=2036206 RepID=A0A347WIY6_9LACT|nr:alpha/beta hydrolase [Suicoccus acidiformans]AXY25043.1 hypothetical protein CL176_02810 [Suicoccus acidiformans]
MQAVPISTICFQDVELSATHFYNPSVKPKGTLLYIHGGGFIFGHRDDLPKIYLEMLTQAGYQILTFDYPLAPESKLDHIFNCLNQLIQWYQNQGYQKIGQPHPYFYLFGRSAGAFASYYLASHSNLEYCKGIIGFYGYYQLNDALFLFPNREALLHPVVEWEKVRHVINDTTVAYSTNSNRYLLYLYGRQTGKWMQLLTDQPEEITKYSLSFEQLRGLPSIFLTHSRRDPDVPFRQSSQIAKQAPNTHFIPVDSTDHDFDRTHINTLGIPIYQQLIEWLNEH